MRKPKPPPVLKVRDIDLGADTATGIEVALPEAPLVLIVGKKGFLMCGYLALEVAEKFGSCAAIVTGVKTTDELLEKPVVKVTCGAERLGIKPGMTGRQALKKLL